MHIHFIHSLSFQTFFSCVSFEGFNIFWSEKKVIFVYSGALSTPSCSETRKYFVYKTTLLPNRLGRLSDEVEYHFFQSDYEKWCHNVNGVFKAFLIRGRPKFDTSTHHFFHVWLTCRKMSGF